MKILISGANGFVGTNLSAYLKAQGHHIIAVSRNPSGENEISWEQLFDNGIDASVIIHLAGKAHDLKDTSNAQEYFDINTELTKRLFNVFLKSNAGGFFFMSSVKAAADTVAWELREDIIPAPKTPYGQSKKQAEDYILNYKLPNTKKVFVLRPCMIHGPGNKGNLNLLYNFVKRGIPYPLAAFDNKRSFLSIGNLNFVINSFISNPNVPGGIYNLADDEPLSTNAVIKLLNEIVGKKNRLWYINPVIIRFVARMGDKIKLPLNSEKLKKLTENYIVSNKKVKDALKISRFPLSSAEGLKITIKSFI